MAIPAILQQLGNGQLNQIKQAMNMIRAAGNPQAMINQMISSNPQMKQAMDLINQHGGDPMKAFYAEAERRGVDPQQIIDMMK